MKWLNKFNVFADGLLGSLLNLKKKKKKTNEYIIKFIINQNFNQKLMIFKCGGNIIIDLGIEGDFILCFFLNSIWIKDYWEREKGKYNNINNKKKK